MWYFNGNAYDLTEFAEKHPGGQHLINETKDYDITYLVQTNHNWTQNYAIKRLEEYKITDDKVDDNRIKIFWDSKLEEIHSTLRSKGINIGDLKTPWYGWVYHLFFGFTYGVFALNWFINNESGFLCGLFGWIWGGFIQHEASHNALSHNKHINNMFRYALIPWTNPTEWFRKHCILHHQYTNTKLDPDFKISESLFVRHHDNVPYHLTMRLQTFTISLYSTISLFLYNIGYVTLIQMALVASHFYIHGSIIGSVLPFVSFGTIFVFITQLNHIQEQAVSDEILDKPSDFVLHQMKSCVDYSYDSYLISSLCSFLNYQTYHHLFPNVSHFHFLTLKNDIEEVISKYSKIQTCDLKTIIKQHFHYLWSISFDNKVKALKSE